jgi:hypothetical protein
MPTEVLPSPERPRSWDSEQVSELRALFENLDRDKWRIGDLVQKMVPVGKNGVRNGADAALVELAKTVERDAFSLENYRRVAVAWPAPLRSGAASWSVHRELIVNGQGDTKTMRALLKKHDGTITVDQARLARGHKIPDDHERVATAKELLSDLAVARGVVEDGPTRMNIEYATQQMDAQRKAVVDRKVREASPKLAEMTELAHALNDIHNARHAINSGLENLRALPGITPEVQAKVRPSLRMLTESYELLVAYVEGDGADLAAQVSDYLAQE